MERGVSKLLICPDCGGEIGGDGKSGHAPCRCALEQFSDFSTASDSGITQALQSTPAGGEVEKRCHVCGKDLKGHRRWKRDAGYICATCREQEKAGGDPADDRETCADCGKKLKPAGMVDYEGMRICRTCHASRKELDKHKPKLIHSTHHDAHEKMKMKLAAAVLLTIALILLVKWAFGL